MHAVYKGRHDRGVLAKFTCPKTGAHQESLLNCDTDNKGMHMSIASSIMNESRSS